MLHMPLNATKHIPVQYFTSNASGES